MKINICVCKGGSQGTMLFKSLAQVTRQRQKQEGTLLDLLEDRCFRGNMAHWPSVLKESLFVTQMVSGIKNTNKNEKEKKMKKNRKRVLQYLEPR